MLDALKALDKFDAGVLAPLTATAAAIGTDVVNLLVFLFKNPTVLAQAMTDAEMQNWSQLELDIKAAWTAANP